MRLHNLSQAIRPLLCNLAETLTVVRLCDLPAVKQGRFNGVLDWLPNLQSLTIALDYIDTRFGQMPVDWDPARWRESKVLQSLTLVTSGRSGDPSRNFTVTDLYSLIDERFLGRLRYLNIARSTEWESESQGGELGALEELVEELDRENWSHGRWHYEDVNRNMTYEQWVETGLGNKMRARLMIFKNR
jgi:hypothetical protein